MAANFGAEATEVGELPVNVTAKAGVAEAPVALQGLNDLFTDATALLKGRREKKEETVVGEFAKKQLLIAEGLSQGKFRNSAHAQMVSRQNLLNAIQANPAMTKDLIAAQSSLMGLAGGAKNVAEGEKEEQRVEARRDSLVANGLVSATATDEEFNAADSAARVAVAAAERHKTRMETLEAESKNLSLTAARRAEADAQIKAETERYVADSAPASFMRVRTEFDKIIKSDAPEADKVNAIKAYYSEWQAQTASTLGNVDSGMRDALKGSFDRLEAQYIAMATGELSDAEAERGIKRTMTTMEATALQDPKIAAMAVTKKLFGEEPLTKLIVGTGGQEAVTAFFKFVAAGPGETDLDTLYTSDKNVKIGQREGLNAVTDALVSGDESKSEEAVGKVGQILESLEDDAGKITRDPKKAIAVVDWIASPGFLKALKSNPDAFNNLDGVKDILEQNYHDEVSGMIRREFKENKVTVFAGQPGAEGLDNPIGRQIPTNSLVEARAVEGGMTFVAIDPENAQARNKAKSLNQTLKPIINTSIKAQAHIAGRNDYKAIWEESSQAILGGQMSGDGGETDLPGGDAGDDLTLESFQEEVGALDQAMTTGGFVGNGDFADAETPTDVAASFVGFNEKEHKDVLSSFIKKAVGTNINPATTAWCAAFVNAALGAKGVKGTGKLNAKSFLNWGEEVSKPTKGDIVVFDRGAPGSWQGHVGFYVGPSDKEGHIKVLGGNQDDKVSIKDYPVNRLEGYRRATKQG